jgi:plasmid replication initiation protein
MSKSNLQVCKSNALVEASYRLSVAEQRIILACISKIRRDQQITDEVLYSVSAHEIAELTGTKSKTNYEELAKAAQRLKRREVRLFEEPNGRGRKLRVMVTGWVQTIVYIAEEGRVELRFTKDMLPYLSELTEQFTRYALADISRMTSAYAIRLYELLIQWRGTGERVLELGWLRDALKLEGRYSNIRDLKRWVLEPAVEQINELSPIWVKWEQRKTGRRVTHIVFRFGEKQDSKPALPKPAKRLERPALKLSLPRAYVEQHKEADEGLVEADQRLLFEIRTGRREPPQPAHNK